MEQTKGAVKAQAGSMSERPSPDPPGRPEVVEESPLIEADLLVEDVSIDGMCGVY